MLTHADPVLTLPKINQPECDLIGPACYALADGSTRTVLGSVRGLLLLDGRHCAADPTPWEETFSGGKRGPRPRAVELLLAGDRVPLGPVDVAAWIGLAAGCDIPTTEVLPGQVECPECHGTGDHFCVHCNRDGDCHKCDGLGTVEGPPEPQDVYPKARVLRFARMYFDLQLFAPLLRLLPPGPAEAFAAKGNLHLVGPGYTLLVPSMTHSPRPEDGLAVLDWPKPNRSPVDA